MARAPSSSSKSKSWRSDAPRGQFSSTHLGRAPRQSTPACAPPPRSARAATQRRHVATPHILLDAVPEHRRPSRSQILLEQPACARPPRSARAATAAPPPSAAHSPRRSSAAQHRRQPQRHLAHRSASLRPSSDRSAATAGSLRPILLGSISPARARPERRRTSSLRARVGRLAYLRLAQPSSCRDALRVSSARCQSVSSQSRARPRPSLPAAFSDPPAPCTQADPQTSSPPCAAARAAARATAARAAHTAARAARRGARPRARQRPIASVSQAEDYLAVTELQRRGQKSPPMITALVLDAWLRAPPPRMAVGDVRPRGASAASSAPPSSCARTRPLGRRRPLPERPLQRARRARRSAATRRRRSRSRPTRWRRTATPTPSTRASATSSSASSTSCCASSATRSGCARTGARLPAARRGGAAADAGDVRRHARLARRRGGALRPRRPVLPRRPPPRRLARRADVQLADQRVRQGGRREARGVGGQVDAAALAAPHPRHLTTRCSTPRRARATSPSPTRR